MKNRIFNFDSPLVNLIFRIADLIVLNLITLICMIPIITIGPALKALAFTSLKMVREEDGSVVKTFWRNFKLNFVQSMLLGFICLAALFVILGDIYASCTDRPYPHSRPFCQATKAYVPRDSLYPASCGKDSLHHQHGLHPKHIRTTPR